MTLARATDADAVADVRAVERRLLRRGGGVRRQLIIMAITGSLTAVTVVAIAWALATAVGDVVAAGGSDTTVDLHLPVVVLITAVAARAVLAWAQTSAAGRGSAAVRAELRRDLLDARLRDPARPDTGSHLWQAIHGIDGIDGYLTRYLPQLVIAVGVPVITGAAVLWADPLSAVIVVATVWLIPVFMILIGWNTREVVDRRRRIQQRLAHHFADLVAGLPTLQVFGRARGQAIGLTRIAEADRRETVAVLRVALLSALVLELLATLSVALIAVVIGLRLVAGELDLTTGLFVLIIAPELYLALRRVGTAYHESADGMAAAQEVFAVVDAAPAAMSPAAATVPVVPADAGEDIVLEGVSVTAPDGRVRLPPLDLTITPGRLIVLTGPSGSGKSTVLAVLTGAVGPSTGVLCTGSAGLDPVIDRDRWLRRLAVVGQHPTTPAGTVADALRLGAPHASGAELRDVLDEVAGHDIALDHHIGAGTVGVSAGELRRIAVARALLRLDHTAASLLVMDEPTAGLDAAAERAVIDAVRRRRVTTVLVSHRPEVWAAADQVVQL